jgi:hypothetical protein
MASHPEDNILHNHCHDNFESNMNVVNSFAVTEILSCIYKGFWKVTSSELLTKQAMRKKLLLYTKNTYIPKLLLNIVTTGIEALVLPENYFLNACGQDCL